MTLACPIPFQKMTATGNDFLLVGLDESEEQRLWPQWFGSMARSEVAKKLCDRHFGVGADGLLILTLGENTDFTWDFYNSDGSTAEMCGNAARCAHLWAENRRQTNRPFRFSTRAGVIETARSSFRDKWIDVSMPNSQILQPQLSAKNFGINWSTDENWSFVNTGVPHLVIPLDHSPGDRELELARKLRGHSYFGAAGSNITFIQPKNSPLSFSTFERGVENFTLSCGTGAVASALWMKIYKKINHIDLVTRGGELAVTFVDSKTTLRGPAAWIADVYIHNHESGAFKP